MEVKGVTLGNHIQGGKREKQQGTRSDASERKTVREPFSTMRLHGHPDFLGKEQRGTRK